MTTTEALGTLIALGFFASFGTWLVLMFTVGRTRNLKALWAATLLVWMFGGGKVTTLIAIVGTLIRQAALPKGEASITQQTEDGK